MPATPVTPAVARTDWRRSTFCAESACVEVALDRQSVAVRDAKASDGPVLEFTREEWVAFVQGVKSGEFDLV